jgi:hypothetical protein
LKVIGLPLLPLHEIASSSLQVSPAKKLIMLPGTNVVHF